MVTRVSEENPEASKAELGQLQDSLMGEKAEIESAINTYASSIFSYAGRSDLGTGLVKFYITFTSFSFRCIWTIALISFAALTFLRTASVERALIGLGIESIIATAIVDIPLQDVGTRAVMIVSNRFLGRTMMPDGTVFWSVSVIFLALGGVLLLAGAIRRVMKHIL